VIRAARIRNPLGNEDTLSVLVTGGAGYIGSVTVELLRRGGEAVVVLDNLSRGHRAAVPEDVPFYEGDVGDRALVGSILREHRVESCIHFAAFAYVGESVERPSLYFENNVSQGISLLGALVAGGVRRFVFSSTCATYGDPEVVPITEDAPQRPLNPYGWSKLMVERVLEAYDPAYGLKFVALRYFNAAGALPHLGERHEPETHLIPRVLEAARGEASHVEVYGTDYPTRDGTCVRDYIHVEDLAAAHLSALGYLRGGGSSEFVNLGNGKGFTVLEVVEAARRITGRRIEVAKRERRAGDPPQLVADASRASRVLGWRAERADLDDIIGSAWAWHLSHPHGHREAAEKVSLGESR
jgi:UDP-glucose 4-epimerase